MFILTCYGWLLFRADSLDEVLRMTAKLSSPLEGFDLATLNTVAVYAVPIFLVQAVEFRAGQLDLFSAWRIPAELRAVCYGVITYLVLFRGGLPQSFIYFQF